MLLQRALACCLLFLIPAVLNAQDDGAPDPGNDQLGDQAMREVLMKMSAVDWTALARNVNDNTARIGELRNNFDSQQTEIEGIKEQLDQINTQMTEQFKRQGEILNAISSQSADGITVNPNALPLTAIMDSNPSFKQDMSDAVHRVIKNEGTFTVENKTSTYRRIFVNRQERGVQPGETVTLKVPTGTVSTQIDGEGLKTWTIGAPNYSQRVEIIPTSGRTTAFYAPTSSSSTTAYYAPTTTTTAYYAPTTTAYYAPTTTAYYAPTTTAYYAPTTTAYYAPTTTTAYYAPTTTAYYAPTTTAYAPTAYYARYRYRAFRWPFSWY